MGSCQQVIEELMRQIMQYDAEFRRDEEATPHSQLSREALTALRTEWSAGAIRPPRYVGRAAGLKAASKLPELAETAAIESPSGWSQG